MTSRSLRRQTQLLLAIGGDEPSHVLAPTALT